MDLIVEIIKEYFVPGSLPFLIFGLAVGVVLLFRSEPAKKWGRRWLSFLVLTYWLLSTPLFAGFIETILSSGYEALQQTDIPENIEAILILGGGSNTYRAEGFEINALSESGILRVMEGARLYFLMDAPQVIVSGGTNPRAGVLTPESEPLHDAFVDLGIQATEITLESASGNTFEQARNMAVMLEAQGIDHFLLVTSPTHMRRALATFEAQGLQPVPAISAQHAETHFAGSVSFLPNPDALHASRMAMREILATLYYALAGRF